MKKGVGIGVGVEEQTPVLPHAPDVSIAGWGDEGGGCGGGKGRVAAASRGQEAVAGRYVLYLCRAMVYLHSRLWRILY